MRAHSLSSATSSARAKAVESLLSRVASLGPANSHSLTLYSSLFFLFIHFHPLSSSSSSSRFPVAASTIPVCGRWPTTESAKPPQTLVQNGSSLLHNTFLSHPHPVASLVKPHSSSTIIDSTTSTSSHVRCREKQSRRWRQDSETTQCLDHLSFRQTSKYAPSPSRPAQTDPGGGVQDHCRTMARRVG